MGVRSQIRRQWATWDQNTGYDKSDRVIARHAEFAGQVAQGVLDVVLHPQICPGNVCNPIGGVVEEGGSVRGGHGAEGDMECDEVKTAGSVLRAYGDRPR